MTIGNQNQINAEVKAAEAAAQQRKEVAEAVNQFAKECQNIARNRG